MLVAVELLTLILAIGLEVLGDNGEIVDTE